MTMAVLTNFFENSINGGRSFSDILFWISWVLAGKYGHEGFPTGAISDSEDNL
jgi:hypothetical protein